MQVSGELTLARRAIDAFVQRGGSHTAGDVDAKVVLLTQSGRLGEAHDLLGHPARTHVPDRAGHAYVLGNTAMTLGRIEEAREQLAIAVKARPGWGPAWLTLATKHANLAKEAAIGDRLLADGAAAERQAPAGLARYCCTPGRAARRSQGEPGGRVRRLRPGRQAVAWARRPTA